MVLSAESKSVEPKPPWPTDSSHPPTAKASHAPTQENEDKRGEGDAPILGAILLPPPLKLPAEPPLGVKPILHAGGPPPPPPPPPPSHGGVHGGGKGNAGVAAPSPPPPPPPPPGCAGKGGNRGGERRGVTKSWQVIKMYQEIKKQVQQPRPNNNLSHPILTYADVC
jgi:hypothetical protein